MTMRVGDTGPDVVEMKNQLRAAGYFNGPDDDYFGEDLADAVRAYQTAHGLHVDGVVGPETWGNIHGDPAYPNNSTGALGGGGGPPGGGAGSSRPNPPKGTDESIRLRYPYLTYLLPDPEVGPLLREADKEGLGAEEFQSRLMQTSWWKNTSDTARTFHQLKSGDPATYHRRRNEKKAEIAEIAGRMGYAEAGHLTDNYLNYFADKALEFGLSSRQIEAMVSDEFVPLVGLPTASNTWRDMRRVLHSYFSPIDSGTEGYWARELQSGRATIENFENAVRKHTKMLFPNLAAQMDAGLTLKDIVEPYRQVLSKEFDGKSPEDFDFVNDPRWRHVIDYVDEKTGVHRTMSMQELSKYARSQPEWRNTKNAKDQVAQIGEQLLQSFGAVK